MRDLILESAFTAVWLICLVVLIWLGLAVWPGSQWPMPPPWLSYPAAVIAGALTVIVLARWP